MNYTPLNSHVLAKRVEHETDDNKYIKVGGILVQEEESDECLGGIVVAADKLNPGDRIYFGKYAGIDIILDGEKYIVLREDEVLLRKG